MSGKKCNVVKSEENKIARAVYIYIGRYGIAPDESTKEKKAQEAAAICCAKKKRERKKRPGEIKHQEEERERASAELVRERAVALSIAYVKDH